MPARPRDLERWSRKGRLDKLQRAMVVRRRDSARGSEGATLDIGAKRRIHAAQLLADHPDERAEAALRDALDDPSPSVRLEIVRGLLVRRSEVEADELAVALNLPEAERASAAAAFGDWARPEPERATELLQAYVDNEADPATTFPVDWATAMWERCDPSDRPVVATAAMDALLADPEHGRGWQLADLDRSATAQAGIPRLDNPELRGRVMELLGRLRAVEAVGPLVERLTGEAPGTRAGAARALGAIRHPAAVRPLLDATADDHAEVRDAAMDAIDRFGSAGTVWGMLSVVESERELGTGDPVDAPGRELPGPGQTTELVVPEGRPALRRRLRRLLG